MVAAIASQGTRMTGFRPLALAALFALAPALPAHAAAADDTARLRAAVDAGQGRAVALLERLVAQNSGSLNVDGVRKVGAMVRAELEPLGFDVRWIDTPATGRAGHLVATHAGSGRGKRVLLIGHLDTVFEPDSPFDRFERKGNIATGPGVADDKGGVVVIVAALRAMHAAGTLRDADIEVFLTGDEELAGEPLEAARAELVAAGKRAGVALEYEPLESEGGRDFATVARRGSTTWDLVATGTTGHSSGVFGTALGFGANFELARIVDAFRRELREPGLTYNVGLVLGGTPATLDAGGARGSASGKTNIVAAQAIARGDLRASTPEQEARTVARMQAIVAAHLPGTSATIAFSERYPPMAATAGNRALLAELNRVNTALGLAAMGEWDPMRRGAADSSFVAADVDVLSGLGAAGKGAHAEGEWVDLDSLRRQALRSAALIGRLSRTPR